MKAFIQYVFQDFKMSLDKAANEGMEGFKFLSFFFSIRILFRVCMHMVVSKTFYTTMFRDTDRDRGFEKQLLI